MRFLLRELCLYQGSAISGTAGGEQLQAGKSRRNNIGDGKTDNKLIRRKIVSMGLREGSMLTFFGKKFDYFEGVVK